MKVSSDECGVLVRWTLIWPRGNMNNDFVEITPSAISLDRLISKVEDPSAGAVATFTGVTRNNFNGKEVLKLEYEAYQPMARKKLQVGHTLEDCNLANLICPLQCLGTSAGDLWCLQDQVRHQEDCHLPQSW